MSYSEAREERDPGGAADEAAGHPPERHYRPDHRERAVSRKKPDTDPFLSAGSDPHEVRLESLNVDQRVHGNNCADNSAAVLHVNLSPAKSSDSPSSDTGAGDQAPVDPPSSATVQADLNQQVLRSLTTITEKLTAPAPSTPAPAVRTDHGGKAADTRNTCTSDALNQGKSHDYTQCRVHAQNMLPYSPHNYAKRNVLSGKGSDDDYEAGSAHATGDARPAPEYEVNQILKHQFSVDANGLPTILFFVSWVGYNDDHNSWEPYEHCSGAPVAVAKYLRQQLHA